MNFYSSELPLFHANHDSARFSTVFVLRKWNGRNSAYHTSSWIRWSITSDDFTKMMALRSCLFSQLQRPTQSNDAGDGIPGAYYCRLKSFLAIAFNAHNGRTRAAPFRNQTTIIIPFYVRNRRATFSRRKGVSRGALLANISERKSKFVQVMCNL